MCCNMCRVPCLDLPLRKMAGKDEQGFLNKIKNWDDQDVSTFLSDYNCSVYVQLFRDNDIRGENILDVDQSALKEMGIPSVADRVRISVAISSLRYRCLNELVQLDDKKSSSVEDSISRSMSLNMTMSKRKPAPTRPSQARPPPLVLDHAQQQHKTDIAYQPQKDKSTKSTLASLGVPGLKRPRGNSNPHRVPSNKELYTTAPLPNPPSSSRKNLLNLSSGSLRRPSTSNVVSRKQFSAHGIRPNTANPALHPYAKPQVSPTESVREEMFENGYRIGAGPYQSHNNSKLSLTDVRRKCVKFITAADGFTRTVDVSECEKADDVLARVLKKFGKINYLSKNQSGAIEDNDRTYFVYQGWGVFRCVDGQSESRALLISAFANTIQKFTDTHSAIMRSSLYVNPLRTIRSVSVDCISSALKIGSYLNPNPRKSSKPSSPIRHHRRSHPSSQCISSHQSRSG